MAAAFVIDSAMRLRAVVPPGDPPTCSFADASLTQTRWPASSFVASPHGGHTRINVLRSIFPCIACRLGIFSYRAVAAAVPSRMDMYTDTTRAWMSDARRRPETRLCLHSRVPGIHGPQLAKVLHHFEHWSRERQPALAAC